MKTNRTPYTNGDVIKTFQSWRKTISTPVHLKQVIHAAMHTPKDKRVEDWKRTHFNTLIGIASRWPIGGGHGACSIYLAVYAPENIFVGGNGLCTWIWDNDHDWRPPILIALSPSQLITTCYCDRSPRDNKVFHIRDVCIYHPQLRTWPQGRLQRSWTRACGRVTSHAYDISQSDPQPNETFLFISVHTCMKLEGYSPNNIVLCFASFPRIIWGHVHEIGWNTSLAVLMLRIKSR